MISRDKEHKFSCQNTKTTIKSKTNNTLSKGKNLQNFELIKLSDFSPTISFDDSNLGKGSYGNVKLVRDKISGRLFALKIVILYNIHLNF